MPHPSGLRAGPRRTWAHLRGPKGQLLRRTFPDCGGRTRWRREGLEGERAFGVGPVAVGDLVAAPSLVAAGVVDVAADGGGAGDAGVGGRIGRIENRVGLVVALGARFALDPYYVAARIDYHVLVSGWASHSYSHKTAEEGGDPFGISVHSCIESSSVVVGGVKGGDFVSVDDSVGFLVLIGVLGMGVEFGFCEGLFDVELLEMRGNWKSACVDGVVSSSKLWKVLKLTCGMVLEIKDEGNKGATRRYAPPLPSAIRYVPLSSVKLQNSKVKTFNF
ncbi:hypothetical protein CR513_18493, partial [Mucuna pruriens]